MTAKTTTGVVKRRAEWRLDDPGPLDGRLRFAFYGLLLLLSLRNLKSPIAGLGFYAETHPQAFRAYGLLDWLGVGYTPVETLHWLIFVTTVAWVASAIGLGGRFATTVTAAGALWLHGMFLGSNALNHYYFLPVYFLVALCFADPAADRWSADYWIRRALGRPEPERRTADADLARRLALLAAVGFYFAAGVAKLTNTGLAWADGETVLYFCGLRAGEYPLADLMLAHPWLARVGAVGTLLLEAGAPIALLSRTTRHAWIGGVVGMHLVIRYSLGPAYWPNILCLLLLVDWRWIARALLGAGVSRPAITSGRSGFMAGFATSVEAAVLALLLAVASFAVFWWPLTNVYMYCGHFSVARDLRAGEPRLDFYTTESVQRIARQYHREAPPPEVAEYFSFRVALRLTGPGARPFYLFDRVGTSTWKQWVLTVARPVLIEDLAAKPPGRLAFEPNRESSTRDWPAQSFLMSYASVLTDTLPMDVLDRYERVELVYPLVDAPAEAVSDPASTIPPEVLAEYAKLEPAFPSDARFVRLAVAPLRQSTSESLLTSLPTDHGSE